MVVKQYLVREMQKYKAENNAWPNVDQRQRMIKVRHIDHSICKRLKEMYDFRCQICGEQIGNVYGDSVVEAHHIDYFVHSLNNDSTNIIILSPNYHRIIHKNNPVFNRKSKTFEFANGEKLRLKLNWHL